MRYRSTVAEINLNNLQHNTDLLHKESHKPLFCVVKANAYGHGATKIAVFLEQFSYVSYFCVSSIDEALELRNNNIKKPIINLGFTDIFDLNECINNNITISIISKKWLIRALEAHHDLSKLKCHIKLDTGMNRLGIKSISEYCDVLEMAKKHGLEVEGVFTHYHSSDSINGASLKQLELFKRFLNQCDHPYKWIHIANTDAALLTNEAFTNAIRCGLALYGYASKPSNLKPILTLTSQVSQAKEIEAGETVSYSAAFVATEKMKIGIVPIGYADGINRKLTNHYFYINGKQAKILGKICMDQTIVKFPYDEWRNIVEIIGPHQNAADLAQVLGTITYEILTGISDRITRTYKLDGQIIDQHNYRFNR